VVDNRGYGVYCAAGYPLKGLLASGNLVNDLYQCQPVSSKVGEAPQFDPARPYHLTATSPCVNNGDATEFPPDDLDGEPRPIGARSDCGADEFKP
jgi:hypothetical protein